MSKSTVKSIHNSRKTKEAVNEFGLTPLQVQFCHAYLVKFNITHAEKELQLPKGTGGKWLSELKVREFINKIRIDTGKAFDVTRERLLQELMAIAYSNVKALGDDIVTWPEDEASTVASIEYDLMGSIRKITRWDKLKAIEMINKMLGFNMPETTKNLNVNTEPISKDEVVEIAKQLKETLW